MRRVYVMDAVKRAKSDRTSNHFMCSEIQTWQTRILAELSLPDRPEIEGTMMLSKSVLACLRLLVLERF
jgi:hypothetical protein